MYVYVKEIKGWSVYYMGEYLGTVPSAKTGVQALRVLMEP